MRTAVFRPHKVRGCIVSARSYRGRCYAHEENWHTLEPWTVLVGNVNCRRLLTNCRRLLTKNKWVGTRARETCLRIVVVVVVSPLLVLRLPDTWLRWANAQRADGTTQDSQRSLVSSRCRQQRRHGVDVSYALLARWASTATSRGCCQANTSLERDCRGSAPEVSLQHALIRVCLILSGVPLMEPVSASTPLLSILRRCAKSTPAERRAQRKRQCRHRSLDGYIFSRQEAVK